MYAIIFVEHKHDWGSRTLVPYKKRPHFGVSAAKSEQPFRLLPPPWRVPFRRIPGYLLYFSALTLTGRVRAQPRTSRSTSEGSRCQMYLSGVYVCAYVCVYVCMYVCVGVYLTADIIIHKLLHDFKISIYITKKKKNSWRRRRRLCSSKCVC